MVSVSITQLDETQALYSCGPHCSCKWRHITHKAEETDLVSVSPENAPDGRISFVQRRSFEKAGTWKKICVFSNTKAYARTFCKIASSTDHPRCKSVRYLWAIGIICGGFEHQSLILEIKCYLTKIQSPWKCCY